MESEIPIAVAAQPPSYGITLGKLKNLKDAAREKIVSDSVKKEATEITQQNLHEAWIKAVEKIASHKVVYKNSILESELTFEQFAITIHTSVVAIDYLKTERTKLLDFFKEYYHNEKINVLFANKIHDIEKSGEKVLSSREIFELMALKNPYLRILKDKFGMDFEY